MNVRHWFLAGIIVLALIGLFSNPSYLLRQALFVIVIAAIIYFIYRVIRMRKPDGKDQRAFIRAAKKTKKKHKKRPTASVSSLQSRKKPIRKKSQANLTVIEGKKGKKKNRAF
ncbi:SA1362 family protein [Falsibacillus pallidus]|uniref:Uncharacterized protein n=1 Tax=Falsibacillus pallidus TaxID=493781 RepID=A0A370GBM6_9BACI|nr:SA1362 family protein [Falsibacillus pallidus]RDI41178.1 hypothetical protein DFR59_10923 [Falsibacillus pallidus]